MRYTESRLSKYGQELLKDIKKNTIDFKPNYDQEEEEPTVLPNLLPNIFLNGSFGIAVGMATKIPSHNIRDIYNAIYYIIDKTLSNEEIDLEEIINIIKAPDFATGGSIIGLSGVREGYRTGKGKILIRSKYRIEEDKKDPVIIIDEIPYGVNKQKLIETINSLMKDTKDIKGKVIKTSTFPQIREIRDESDKDGMRIVIELKKDANPQLVINHLIKYTNFQTSFNMNMISLVDGEPKLLNIAEMLENFLAHAASVIMRKTQFELDKASRRLNIVNGILKCFSFDENEEEVLSQVINIMRTAENPITSLCDIGFNQLQAEYIAELKLRNLSRDSQDKFIEEEKTLNSIIVEFNSIIDDEEVLLKEMKKQFKELEDKFGDERRTAIETNPESLEEEDLIEDEMLVVTYTTEDTIKTVEEGEYKSQKRGGKGVKATKTKDDEIIKFMFTSGSKDDLLFFTTEGRCHIVKTYKIGKSSKIAKGRNINNYLNLNVGEKIIGVLSTNIKNKEDFLLFITRKGQLKKLSLEQLSARNVTKVISFKENDYLVKALLIKEEDNVLIVTGKGKSVRINTSATGSNSVRPMGRTAVGVNGITVAKNDNVVDMCIIKDEDSVLTITETGLGKRTKAKAWSVKGRGGKGMIAHDITEKTGEIVSAMIANDSDELFLATEQGLITRVPTKDIRNCGRSSQGVKIVNLNDNDRVASVSINEIEEITSEE